MEFKEIEKEPEFTLTMSLEEAISLWRIANNSYKKGNEKAKPFVEALYEFAANSNDYNLD
jgi:hypothetical protein